MEEAATTITPKKKEVMLFGKIVEEVDETMEYPIENKGTIILSQML